MFSQLRKLFPRTEFACQLAFSRAMDAADSGAAAARSPRSARSKSPWANLCKYISGRSRPTSSVRRLNSGSSRLSKRASSPRTRGRRTVIVVSARGSGCRHPEAAPPSLRLHTPLMVALFVKLDIDMTEETLRFLMEQV